MNSFNVLKLSLFVVIFSSCEMIDKFEKKAAMINDYEQVSLQLIHQNRLLKSKNQKLNYKISELSSKNTYLKIKLSKSKRQTRKIASVELFNVKDDQVKDNVYDWKSNDLLNIARKEFDLKHYMKASQFYITFYNKYKTDKRINDNFLFEAGISAYESKKYLNWSIKYFTLLIHQYPNSKYFRAAKLWRGMSYLKLGKRKEFFATVEEFRMKYRNTAEWEILSKNYEKMVQKYK